MSGHTPGPWWIDSPSKTSAVQQIRADGPGGNRAVVADIRSYRGLERAAADARLIAAAPDLLEALKSLREAWDNFMEHDIEPDEGLGIFTDADAAIKKAEGA